MPGFVRRRLRSVLSFGVFHRVKVANASGSASSSQTLRTLSHHRACALRQRHCTQPAFHTTGRTRCPNSKN